MQGKQIPYYYSRRQAEDEAAALRVVKTLLAAGYRPTVYRNVAPPPFLGRGSEVVEAFDPFDFHSPDLSPRQATQRVDWPGAMRYASVCDLPAASR